jgi:hypothetical protein
MKASPLAPLTALLGVPDDAAVTLQSLDVRDWGQVLVFVGKADEQAFELRYDDCRELRWRVYAHEQPGETPIVSFAPGRDQQRSPAQFLTGHFGLSLFYGSFSLSRG